jgi:hypothetical protein
MLGRQTYARDGHFLSKDVGGYRVTVRALVAPAIAGENKFAVEVAYVGSFDEYYVPLGTRACKTRAEADAEFEAALEKFRNTAPVTERDRSQFKLRAFELVYGRSYAEMRDGDVVAGYTEPSEDLNLWPILYGIPGAETPRGTLRCKDQIAKLTHEG